MEITRLFEVPYYQDEHFSKNVSMANKENGQWVTYSTKEVIEIVNKLSYGLIKKGIKPGDKVAIVSFNRPEWMFADFAIQQVGAIGVPLYPTISVKDYAFTLNQSESKLVFVDNTELFDKVQEARPELAVAGAIYTFDQVPGAQNYKELLAEEADAELQKELQSRMDAIKPDDLVTIIYTSGTTGEPKGVMLSHANININSMGVGEAFYTVKESYKALSFLPLCHIYERTASYTHMRKGSSVYFSTMDEIANNLKEIKPDYFDTVPRLLEKVYDKIVKKGHELSGVKKALFFWSIRLAEKFEPGSNMGVFYLLQHKIVDKLIFRKWREALGGNVEFINVGAAAMQPRLGRIFWAAGIKVCEGYGLTETSPVISFNNMRKGEHKIGTVGPLLQGVEVKFGNDGEIITRGPNIMLGYYKQPEMTAEVLDADGWFSTGDIGEMDGNFLKITDRKKEMFKTSGGKYIAPQQMENTFKQSLLIEQIMVVGEGEKHPAGLIIPEFDSLKEWCQLHGIVYTSNAEMIENERVIEKYAKEIDHYNEDYAQFEKVKKFKLLRHVWSIETGELTPTLKLKRTVIMNKCDKEVRELYEEE